MTVSPAIKLCGIPAPYIQSDYQLIGHLFALHPERLKAGVILYSNQAGDYVMLSMDCRQKRERAKRK